MPGLALPDPLLQDGAPRRARCGVGIKSLAFAMLTGLACGMLLCAVPLRPIQTWVQEPTAISMLARQYVQQTPQTLRYKQTPRLQRAPEIASKPGRTSLAVSRSAAPLSRALAVAAAAEGPPDIAPWAKGPQTDGFVEARLKELGLDIPMPMAPVASYLPYKRSGNQIFISGQIPKQADGTLLKGKLGSTATLEEGQNAARVCGINLIAQMKAALGGNLDLVTAVVRVEGFVNSVDDFESHHLVINACSDLMQDVFGPKVGVHSRFAVGCSSLPLGVPVEIGAVIEIRDSQEPQYSSIGF